MAISEEWAYLLEPGLREVFFLTYDGLLAQSPVSQLFNVITSNKAVEYFLGAGGMGDWQEYKGAIEYDDMEQLYRTSLTHAEYARGFKVERKLVDDDQYNIIQERPRALAMAAARTREKHAASVFNNAFSTSYQGGDAKPLCESAGHPYSPSNASTQTNEGSSALSYDNVITIFRAMQEFKDDRGELVSVNPDTLLVPPELAQTAKEILLTTQNKPNTTDTVVNYVNTFLNKVIVWHYLTDANAWFMIDSQLAKRHLLWVDRVGMEFALDPTSNYRLEARYRGYMRYSYGWSDWRWVYGNNPS
jgi:phage major head subunit gpT-like protein